jgi:hypothetical protein
MQELEFSTSNEMPVCYRWGNVGLRINNAEIEERIRQDGDKWDKGVYDVRARAAYMHQAFKAGLKESVHRGINESMSDPPIGLAALGGVRVGAVGIIYLILKAGHVPDEIAKPFAVTYPFWLEAVGHHLINKNIIENLPKRQWSIINFPQVDRLLAANALLHAGKLIRAKTTV